MIHLSKLKKVRVKVNEKQGNHGPWNYLSTERIETHRTTTSRYRIWNRSKGFEYQTSIHLQPKGRSSLEVA
jgi:hypothetical protein